MLFYPLILSNKFKKIKLRKTDVADDDLVYKVSPNQVKVTVIIFCE